MADNSMTGGVDVGSLPDGGVSIREGSVHEGRDAQDGPVLAFTREEWVAFVAGVENGEFDPALPGVASPDC